MSTVEYTDSELHQFHIRYFSQLTLYQTMIFIQIVLIITTAIKFRQKAQEKKLTKDALQTNNRMKYLFFAVLSNGTVVFVLVEWYGIADFLYDFAAWTNYCDVAAILCNLSIMTYLLALFLFYLYRLHATFQNSSIGLSSCMKKTLLGITLSVYFIMVILVFIFQKGAVKHTPFAWSGKKGDYKPIIICEGEFSIGIDPKLRWVLQAIVCFANVFYGYMFYKKLYDLVAFMKVQKQKTDGALRRLMSKQAILVLVSTTSTIIMWSITNVLHYFGSYWQILIYLDISINCLCLFLMFSWNDALFAKLCKPCAVLDSICCSRFATTDPDINNIKNMEKEIDSHHSQQVHNKNKIHIHAYNDEATISQPTDLKPEQSAETKSVEMPSQNIIYK